MRLSVEETLRNLKQVEEKYKIRFIPTGEVNISEMARDCIDTIEALKQENEQLQKERNAAIADMRHLVLIWGGGCSVCKRWNKANPKLPWCNKNYTCEFEWRGLEEGSV